MKACCARRWLMRQAHPLSPNFSLPYPNMLMCFGFSTDDMSLLYLLLVYIPYLTKLSLNNIKITLESLQDNLRWRPGGRWASRRDSREKDGGARFNERGFRGPVWALEDRLIGRLC